METKPGLAAILALAALSLALFGCASSEGPPLPSQEGALGQDIAQAPARNSSTGQQATWRGPGGNGSAAMIGNRSGIMRNLSDAERQQLFSEMTKQAQEACGGKSEGDSCTLQSPTGPAINGTCKSQDESLICIGGVRRAFGQIASNSG